VIAERIMESFPSNFVEVYVAMHLRSTLGKLVSARVAEQYKLKDKNPPPRGIRTGGIGGRNRAYVHRKGR
jgi:hypothetical protein